MSHHLVPLASGRQQPDLSPPEGPVPLGEALGWAAPFSDLPAGIAALLEQPGPVSLRTLVALLLPALALAAHGTCLGRPRARAADLEPFADRDRRVPA